MKISKRGSISSISLLLIFLGFLIGYTTPTGFSLGDRLFLDLGLSPWSNGQTGFHNTILVTLVLLIIGGIGTISEVPNRKLVILIFLSFLITPLCVSLMKPVYFKMHTGLAAIEYNSRSTHFNIRSSEDNKKIEVTGLIVLTNYGRNPIKIGIKIPSGSYIQEKWFSHDLALTGTDISGEPGIFTLPPREIRTILTFSTIPSQHAYNRNGSMHGPNLILFTDDEMRMVGRNL